MIQAPVQRSTWRARCKSQVLIYQTQKEVCMPRYAEKFWKKNWDEGVEDLDPKDYARKWRNTNPPTWPMFLPSIRC